MQHLIYYFQGRKRVCRNCYTEGPSQQDNNQCYVREIWSISRTLQSTQQPWDWYSSGRWEELGLEGINNSSPKTLSSGYYRLYFFVYTSGSQGKPWISSALSRWDCAPLKGKIWLFLWGPGTEGLLNAPKTNMEDTNFWLRELTRFGVAPSVLESCMSVDLFFFWLGNRSEC